MRSSYNQGFRLYSLCLAFTVILFYACSNPRQVDDIPAELLGTWTSPEVKINVRETTGFMDFDFHPGTGGITLIFRKNEKVSGSIGSYHFSNGSLLKSTIYLVACDSVGQIFPGDPVTSKELSFWLHEVTENKIKGELRLTEEGAKYPMAGFTLTRE